MAGGTGAYDVVVIARDRLAGMGVRFLLLGNDRIRAVSVCREAPAAVAVPTVAILADDPCQDELRRLCGRWPALVVTATRAMAPALAAVRCGARSVVTTDTDRTEMRVALDSAAAGGLYLGRGLLRSVPEPVRPCASPARGRGRAPALAPREVQTLRLIAHGLTHSEAARELGLTVATVDTYVKRIRAKLSVGNKAELTRHAIQFGYVPARSTVDTVRV